MFVELSHPIDGWSQHNHDIFVDEKSGNTEPPQNTPQHEPLHPVIQEFQQVIESDAELHMLFHQMFEQVPRTPPYDKDPSGKPQVIIFSFLSVIFGTEYIHKWKIYTFLSGLGLPDNVTAVQWHNYQSPRFRQGIMGFWIHRLSYQYHPQLANGNVRWLDCVSS